MDEEGRTQFFNDSISICVSSKKPLTIDEFKKDYLDLVCSIPNLRDFGFDDVRSSIIGNTRLKLRRNQYGEEVIQVVDERVKHIQEMVQNQKNPSKKSKGNRNRKSAMSRPPDNRKRISYSNRRNSIDDYGKSSYNNRSSSAVKTYGFWDIDTVKDLATPTSYNEAYSNNDDRSNYGNNYHNDNEDQYDRNENEYLPNNLNEKKMENIQPEVDISEWPASDENEEVTDNRAMAKKNVDDFNQSTVVDNDEWERSNENNDWEKKNKNDDWSDIDEKNGWEQTNRNNKETNDNGKHDDVDEGNWDTIANSYNAGKMDDDSKSSKTEHKKFEETNNDNNLRGNVDGRKMERNDVPRQLERKKDHRQLEKFQDAHKIEETDSHRNFDKENSFQNFKKSDSELFVKMDRNGSNQGTNTIKHTNYGAENTFQKNEKMKETAKSSISVTGEGSIRATTLRETTEEKLDISPKIPFKSNLQIYNEIYNEHMADKINASGDNNIKLEKKVNESNIVTTRRIKELDSGINLSVPPHLFSVENAVCQTPAIADKNVQTEDSIIRLSNRLKEIHITDQTHSLHSSFDTSIDDVENFLEEKFQLHLQQKEKDDKPEKLRFPSPSFYHKSTKVEIKEERTGVNPNDYFIIRTLDEA
ncbi:hypothetical protein SNEBB_006121 [Seison nebaliae]|nr:hypothetical protein SNEBB_006121 [Seison nebaliae]